MKLISALLLRQFLVWRQLWIGSTLTNFANPALFLYAFGFGLGSMLATVGGVDYLSYIVPGMVAYSILFSANFDTTINAYSRFQVQRTYDALLATPVRLPHIVLSEILWAALKALVNGAGVLLVAAFFGGVDSLSNALLTLPLFLLGGLVIASIGLMFTSLAKGFEFFSYIFTLWVTPNFLFTGVFWEIDRYPWFIEYIAYALPLHHLVEATRPLLLNQPVDMGMFAIHVGYLAVLTAVATAVALARFNKRLFD